MGLILEKQKGQKLDRADKFCLVAHNVCRTLDCNLVRVTRFVPIILQWFIGFLKSCAPTRKEFVFALGLNSRETPAKQLTADSHVTATLLGVSKVTGAKYIQHKVKQNIRKTKINVCSKSNKTIFYLPYLLVVFD